MAPDRILATPVPGTVASARLQDICDVRGSELSRTLMSLRAPLKSRSCLKSGNFILSAAKQHELRLSPIPVGLLHLVLMPFINKFPSASFSGLGEAFIKVFTSTYFFAQYQDDFEGLLTKRVQNESRLVVLSSYMLSSCLALYVCTEAGDEGYSDRVAAGVFHGVIGVAVSSGGADQGIQTLANLGMDLNPRVRSLGDICSMYKLSCPVHTIDSPVLSPARNMLRIWIVQFTLGYIFSDPRLLLQAVNHRSSTISPSYERLEFLGDAVLEFVVANHYRRKFRSTSLGKFRVFKQRVLSNDALGTSFLLLDWKISLSQATEALKLI